MEEALRPLVRIYLDGYMLSNALFLCERLVAYNPSEENVLLLATCHLRDGADLRAHALLQGSRAPQNRYLLALCCLNMGKLAEAERALLEGTKVLDLGPKACKDALRADPCPIPNGAAGLYLLGEEGK
ncbi:unnamed protein product [Choristocarpus tenellus]